MVDQLRDLIPVTPALDSLNAGTVLLTLSVAALCGLVIYLVYRYFNRGVVYSAGFNMLTVMVCVVTAFIIITIGANLVLSLGMVGALSIVRFRAAVKDPLDVGFLFWGVAAGLTAGAGLYLVALLGTAFIAVLYSTLTIIRLEKHVYLLIIRYNAEAEPAVAAAIKPLKSTLKNKTLTDNYIELTAEIRLHRGDTRFLAPLKELVGVTSATLVAYTGDYVC